MSINYSTRIYRHHTITTTTTSTTTTTNTLLFNQLFTSCISCGPVYSKMDVSICGRCAHINRNEIISDTRSTCVVCEDTTVMCIIAEEVRVHNIYYESIASLLLFPCKYFRNGCREKLPFCMNTPHPHERECTYKTNTCPLDVGGACGWHGQLPELLEHCQQAHMEHVLTVHPYSMYYDFHRSRQDCYLIHLYEKLFLLHVKVCTSTYKVFHAVQMLGPEIVGLNFQYSVELERDNAIFRRTKRVLNVYPANLSEQTAITVNIINLVRFIGGYEGTKFTIHINKLLSSSCNVCQEKFDTIDENELMCPACKQFVVYCQNRHLGCTYQDSLKVKCYKHETFFCTYNTKCPASSLFNCNQHVYPGKLFRHLCVTHAAIRKPVGCRWRTVGGGFVKFCLVYGDYGDAICAYNFINGTLIIELSMPVPTCMLYYYDAKICIIDPVSGYNESATPVKEFTRHYDWSIEFKLENAPLWYKTGLDVIVDIHRNDSGPLPSPRK